MELEETFGYRIKLSLFKTCLLNIRRLFTSAPINTSALKRTKPAVNVPQENSWCDIGSHEVPEEMMARTAGDASVCQDCLEAIND